MDCVPAYVESTLEAAPFYKKHGFSAMEKFSVEIDGGWQRSPKTLYEEVSFIFKP